MQDRYAGDIGDYGKFGLLRALASKGLSIGVNWYLVETPSQELAVNDGNKLIPSKLEECDPKLAAALQAISRSPERSVRALEEADLIPGATYYSCHVPVEGRAAWHSHALSALAGTDLVFLDPDNGLLVKSVGKRSAKSPKYTFYEEVACYVARGQSVMVYNHRSRKKPDVYFGEICERLAAAVPQASDIAAITFPKGSVRDYFAISASPEHARLVREAFGNLAYGVWGDKGMCRLEILPKHAPQGEHSQAKHQERNQISEGTNMAGPQLIGFWQETEPLGCFSNWHPTGFDFRGTYFATGEHWMMWQKACLMGDSKKAAQILAAPTPRKAKELGGEVKPYDGKLWDAVREQLVYYGVREKFLQNDAERDLMLSTGSSLLAEASPYDKVWGVGMTADDPSFANPAKWQGDNLLGRASMRVRTDIRQLMAMGRLDDVLDTYQQPDDSIARMTLLQLSRIPAARAAVYCYARIVSHAMPQKYPTAGAFLKKEHDATIEGIATSMAGGVGAGLPVTGWHELVRELVVLQVLEKL